MRTKVCALLIAAGVLAGGNIGRSDECCSQGSATPWKKYNAGVKWSVGLSKDTGRWEALAEKGLKIEEGSSLAERVALLTTQSKRGVQADWKRGLKPALERARREDKLVLFFQLVGDLDLEGC